MRDHTKLRAFELAKDVRVKVRLSFSIFLKSRLHLYKGVALSVWLVEAFRIL
jgi:hypothetical protein